MDRNFWIQKWEKNDTAFHEPQANPSLVKHIPKLSLKKESRIFLPLCGKTLDIAWLLENGYRVAGAELSSKAIGELFDGLGVKPEISAVGNLEHYSAPDIDIFVGNIFDLSGNALGPVDAVYDRAALVALPEDMRRRYTAHLTDITKGAPQLLLSFDYDQRQMEGPPFSVSNGEVKQHYQARYKLTLLETFDIPGGLKGKCPAKENVWLLEK